MIDPVAHPLAALLFGLNENLAGYQKRRDHLWDAYERSEADCRELAILNMIIQDLSDVITLYRRYA